MAEERSSDGKMSYSSASKITGCQRRYYYAKVKKYPADTDAPDDHHFRFGKALHDVLETCMHDPKKHHNDHILKACEKHMLGKDDAIKIGSMIMTYFQLHSKSCLTCVACEFSIESYNTIGWVDAVMKDVNGYWWIVDLKTSARIKTSDLLSRLHKDLQLNLYAAFREQIALKLGLDPRKFLGARYRVGQKPDMVVRDNDTVGSYHTRAYPLFVDVEIPVEVMNPDAAMAYINSAYEMSQEIKEFDEEQVMQNFSDCNKYFRPCEYWSRCYGQCFTSTPKIREYTHGTMTDRTYVPSVTTTTTEEDPFAELAEGFDFLN